MSYKNDYFQRKVFSLLQISLMSEEKPENRARDDALFWISILSLYSHPQLSSRKGNETQDDRKAFPDSSFTVIMACLLSVSLWQLLNHQWENTGSILALSV